MFLQIVNMSITASWLVLAVIVLRFLLRKAPKSIICVLWGLVAVRLIFPISIESPLSLIPSEETIPLEIEYAQTPQIDSGISSIDTAVNPIIQENFTPSDELTSMNPIQLPIHIGAYLWQIGIVIMALYAIISYVRIKLKVREAIKIDGNIYECDRIPSPFILGVIRPKIYLPSTLSEDESNHVIAHEKAHIKRLDYIWKPLGYILLTVYWFNPVLWLGYILLCRDIEYACDEKVVKEMNLDAKKEYSTTLLNLSVHNRYVTACPLAFGESGVKSRIKSVLNYKKPAFWVIIVAIVLCVVMAVCFLTNPPADNPHDMIGTYYGYKPLDSYLPYLKLNDDGTFLFAYNVYANFILRGNYQLTNSELTLNVRNGTEKGETFVFDFVDNNFIFNEEKSTPYHVEYIPDGTVLSRGFAFSDAVSIDFDIDNDGTEELCVVDYALLLDVNAIEVRVYENNTREYYETLIIGDDTFSFEVIDNALKLKLEDNTSSLVRYFDLFTGDNKLFIAENFDLCHGDLTNHPDYVQPDEYKDGLANINLKKYYHDDIVDVMSMTEAKQITIKYFDYDFNNDNLTDKFAIVSSPIHSGSEGETVDILINNGNGTYTDIFSYNLQLFNASGDMVSDVFIRYQHNEYSAITIKSDKVRTFVFDGEKYNRLELIFSNESEDITNSAETNEEELVNRVQTITKEIAIAKYESKLTHDTIYKTYRKECDCSKSETTYIVAVVFDPDKSDSTDSFDALKYADLTISLCATTGDINVREHFA